MPKKTKKQKIQSANRNKPNNTGSDLDQIVITPEKTVEPVMKIDNWSKEATQSRKMRKTDDKDFSNYFIQDLRKTMYAVIVILVMLGVLYYLISTNTIRI